MSDGEDDLPEIAGKIIIDDKSREEQKAVRNQENIKPPVSEAEQIRNDRAKQDNQQSNVYAERAYNIVYVWIVFLLLIIIMQFFLRRFGFGLEKEEFIAVVGSLTASMFGFWYLVGRHLFPVQKDEK